MGSVKLSIDEVLVMKDEGVSSHGLHGRFEGDCIRWD